MAVAAGDDPLAEEDEENAPAESPQPTRVAAVRAVELPPVDDAETRCVVAEGQLVEPLLQFPFDVPLQMDRAAANQEPADSEPPTALRILDRTDGDVIAYVDVTNHQSRFRWTDQAQGSPAAKSLFHGRIRDGQQTIYLRPSIEADAWKISFDRSDTRPTWDLGSILPPRVTRLATDLKVLGGDQKNSIEFGWIEPVESTSPRRTRGLAIVTPPDGETVAVGLRFDIRCSRTLSCRVRTFGRLDPEAPWQLVSRPMLDRVADQLTTRATRLSHLSTQIETVYSKSDARQRRQLAPQRDAIKGQADRVQMIADRVAALWSLIGRIENEVEIQTRLWVQWPDETEQDLFATASTEQERASELD
jgi:hypothetical protein